MRCFCINLITDTICVNFADLNLRHRLIEEWNDLQKTRDRLLHKQIEKVTVFLLTRETQPVIE